ncbi:hypothetical protein B9Z55_006991 [Caenorhabditis nigoni]|nr:hypothetical protein B9Z55_006991 [Caenorhabditis nigoni]
MQPVPLYPLVSGYILGFLAQFGATTHHCMNIVIACLIYQIESMIFCFVRKHQAIANTLKKYIMPRWLVWSLFFFFAFDICMVVGMYAQTSMDQDAQFDYIRQNYPEYLSGFQSLPNFSIYDPGPFFVGTVLFAVTCGIVSFFILCLILANIFRMLGILKTQISASNYQKHRAAIWSLLAQFATSSVCVVPPIFFVFVVLIGIDGAQIIVEFLLVIACLHSSLNVTVLIITFPPYRKFVVSLIFRGDERFSISGRCPEISRVEKGIPLRVEEIWLTDNRVQIDDVEYEVVFEEPGMATTSSWSPPNIIMPNDPLTLRFHNYQTNRVVDKKISRNYGVETANRKVIEYLLGGRNNIRVQCLFVFYDGYETMQHLLGLSMMKVNELKSYDIGLTKCYAIIQTPLKKLRFGASHPSDFENPIVRTAEKIEISHYGYSEPDIWLETHKNLPNKEVIINAVIDGLTDIKVLNLIEYWRETRRAVGSSFSLLKANGDSIKMFLENVKDRFQGTYVELKVTNTNTFFNIDAVSIKMNSESKIVVYGGKTNHWPKMVSKVVIKMMAVGSSSEIQEKVEPLEEQPKIVPGKPLNLVFIVVPLLTFLIILCLWLFC